MKIKYNNEIIAGILSILFSAAAWFLIPSQIPTLEKTAITAKTVPSIAVGGLFLFSLALFFQGLFGMPKKEVHINTEFLKSEKVKKELRSFLFITLLLIYAFFIGKIGFLISTLLLVVVILIFYGARKWYYYGIAAVTVFIVDFVFSVMLHVSLP